MIKDVIVPQFGYLESDETIWFWKDSTASLTRLRSAVPFSICTIGFGKAYTRYRLSSMNAEKQVAGKVVWTSFHSGRHPLDFQMMKCLWWPGKVLGGITHLRYPSLESS